MNPLKGLRFRDWVLISVILGVMYFCCVSCTASRPRPAQLPTVASVLQLDSLPTRPDSLPAVTPPKPTILQRVAAVVSGGKAKSKVKFKGPTTIVLGNDNVASAATRPGTVATGAAAVATDAKKATGPVVIGEGNQTASSKKGPAAAGEGITQTAPPPRSVWPWLLGGVAVGFALRQFGPQLLRRLLLRI